MCNNVRNVYRELVLKKLCGLYMILHRKSVDSKTPRDRDDDDNDGDVIIISCVCV